MSESLDHERSVASILAQFRIRRSGRLVDHRGQLGLLIMAATAMLVVDVGEKSSNCSGSRHMTSGLDGKQGFFWTTTTRL